MDLCHWTYCDTCSSYSKKCNRIFISNVMHYARYGHLEMKYNWKDLLVDTAIVVVVLGVLELIVGSFPATFSKLLSFLK